MFSFIFCDFQLFPSDSIITLFTHSRFIQRFYLCLSFSVFLVVVVFFRPKINLRLINHRVVNTNKKMKRRKKTERNIHNRDKCNAHRLSSTGKLTTQTFAVPYRYTDTDTRTYSRQTIATTNNIRIGSRFIHWRLGTESLLLSLSHTQTHTHIFTAGWLGTQTLTIFTFYGIFVSSHFRNV